MADIAALETALPMSAPSSPQYVQELYSTVEFDRWAGRSELDADERFLITRYLSPTATTLEAGTGGGRILLAMRKMGFSNLRGFDFVPGLVESARAADASGTIAFDVENAAELSYAEGAFDQVVYLQQLLSCIDDDEVRSRASRESFRVLKPGAVALFSVLSFEVRRQSLVYRNLIRWWRMLRTLRGSRVSPQALPWMRLGDRFHVAALWDREPYVYWFRIEEFVERLKQVGFEVRAVGTSAQIAGGGMLSRIEELRGKPLRGAFYCVATKPSTDGRAGLKT